MSKHRSAFELSCFLLAVLSSASVAQGMFGDELFAGIECGGQYECVEDRPLTPTEALSSRAYPQIAQQGPEYTDRVAVASVAEPREANTLIGTYSRTGDAS
jgi:hypothetical protein